MAKIEWTGWGEQIGSSSSETAWSTQHTNKDITILCQDGRVPFMNLLTVEEVKQGMKRADLKVGEIYMIGHAPVGYAVLLMEETAYNYDNVSGAWEKMKEVPAGHSPHLKWLLLDKNALLFEDGLQKPLNGNVKNSQTYFTPRDVTLTWAVAGPLCVEYEEKKRLSEKKKEQGRLELARLNKVVEALKKEKVPGLAFVAVYEYPKPPNPGQIQLVVTEDAMLRYVDRMKEGV